MWSTIFSNLFYIDFILATKKKREKKAIDGSLIIIVDQWYIFIFSYISFLYIVISIILKNTFLVPKLFINLFSIQNITTDLLCKVVFCPSHCVFQENNLGMVWLIKANDGIYYFEDSIVQKLHVVFNFISSIWNLQSDKYNIWLQYLSWSLVILFSKLHFFHYLKTIIFKNFIIIFMNLQRTNVLAFY